MPLPTWPPAERPSVIARRPRPRPPRPRLAQSRLRTWCQTARGVSVKVRDSTTWAASWPTAACQWQLTRKHFMMHTTTAHGKGAHLRCVAHNAIGVVRWRRGALFGGGRWVAGERKSGVPKRHARGARGWACASIRLLPAQPRSTPHVGAAVLQLKAPHMQRQSGIQARQECRAARGRAQPLGTATATLT